LIWRSSFGGYAFSGRTAGSVTLTVDGTVLETYGSLIYLFDWQVLVD